MRQGIRRRSSRLRNPALATSCVCGGDGRVTVDELVKGVNIALGNMQLERCQRFDANGNGRVTIDELVCAVNAALNGCG